MSSGEGSSINHPVNFIVNGAANIDVYITPDSSSSTVGQFFMKYQVTETG